jgi:hypothetical protein
MPRKRKKKNKVNEPAAEYSRELRFFNSFEEQKAYEIGDIKTKSC